jgi:hypothetical protein
MASSALRLLERYEHAKPSREPQLRRVLVVTVTTAVAAALLSCSETRPSAGDPSTTSSMMYQPAGPVVRAPLAPPTGYSSPSQLANSPTPLAPYMNAPNENAEPQTTGPGEWRESPRWAAIKGEGCIEVIPAEEDAGKVKVENCPKDGVGDAPRHETFGLPPE